MKKNFLKVALVAAVAAMAGYAHQTMKKGLYILLCSLLVVSCSFPEKKGEGQEAVGKVLSYAEALPLRQKYSDLFSRVEIVPLDTVADFLVADIRQFRYALNRFFVLSGDELLVFDRRGKGMARIDRRGQGREEYLSIRGFDVSEEDSTVCLLTFPPKLMYFSLDGTFVRECVMESRGFEMALLPDRSVAVYADNVKRGDTEKPALLDTYRAEDLRRKSFVQGYSHWEGKLIPSYQQKRVFTHLPDDKGILFSHPLSNRIYSLTSADTVETKYTLDFGKDNPPLDTPDRVRPEMAVTDVVKKYWPVYGFNSCWENSRYLYVQAFVGGECTDLLYDKRSSQFYAGWLENDLLQCQMNPVEATDTCLVGYVPTDNLVHLSEYLRLNPDQKLSEQTKRLMEWADQVGNPVVCLYWKESETSPLIP